MGLLKYAIFISGEPKILERSVGSRKTTRKIMAMALKNQHFDLEYFMKSTDVGLYNVAKEIFSYLDPPDLKNMEEIGKKNTTFEKFLNQERNFLYGKFEKVTLKIVKRKSGALIGPK